MVKIGIIGGSGLDDPKLLSNYDEKEIDTPYGKPSSKITLGKINGVEVCILARHGKNHEIPPSLINYRANIYAFKMLGCDFIIATSAVGSLRDEIKPGNLVFPNQFIDFTKQRKMSFFDSIREVKHTSMSEPYSLNLREILCKISDELGFNYNKNKAMVVIEGPRFSTKAESFMFRQLGADIIGMTGCPECSLANEIGIPYQTIAMSTDYDCWKEGEEPVTWEMVVERMHENADKVKRLLIEAIPRIANADCDFIENSKEDITPCPEFSNKTISNICELSHEIAYIKSKITSIPNFPKPGIIFRDITTLLADPDGVNRVIDIFYNRYKDKKIDVIAGIESRGFIIGSLLANRLNIPFVLVRKKGKLPREVIREEYELEYGKDSIEMHRDSIKYGQRVLVADDLVATSGTCLAACNLVKKLGGDIVECAFIIELGDLGGRKKMESAGYKIFSVVKYEEFG